jgi:hypothetical protein
MARTGDAVPTYPERMARIAAPAMIALRLAQTRRWGLASLWPRSVASIELDIATFLALPTNLLDDGPFEDVRAARVKQAIIAFDKHYLTGLASAR